MRASFEPLAPATGELETEVARIAGVAGELQGLLRRGGGEESEKMDRVGERQDSGAKRRQRETVRRVLDAPGRLEGMVKRGLRQEAEREWGVVSGYLERWEGVAGADAVRRNCEIAIESIDRR